MKKFIISILIIIVSLPSFGQAIIQRAGPANTVNDVNLFTSNSFKIPVFNDSATANLATSLDSCGKMIYVRDLAAILFRACVGASSRKWMILMPTGTPSSDTFYWRTTGNAQGSNINFLGTTDAYNLRIGTDNTVRVILPAAGLTFNQVVSDTTANKVMTFNPSTKEWGYGYWFGGGGAATTPISSLTAAAASNTISNANYTQQWGWALTGSQSALQLANTTSTASGNEKVLEISSSGAHASNNITTYGSYITNSHSGTGSINVALNARALNGDENIAAWFGRGKVRLGTTSFEKGILEILGNTSGTVTIQPAAAAGTWTMTLPTTDGNSGEYLQTDGNGVTSWAAVTAGANTALSNLSSVAINTSLLPGTDNSIDLGSGSNQWRYGIFGTGGISIGAAAAPSIGRLQVETGGGANGGITLRNTTAGAYSTMDFYNNGGFNGQFLFTGSTYTNGFFNGNQLAFANYASGGNVGFVAGTASGYIKFGAGALTAAAEKMRINSTGVGIANSSPVALLTLGTAGTTLGSFSSAGNTSGVISFLPQAAAGTYNWNWPTTAGTSGYFLTSGGGGSTAMTWTNPASIFSLSDGSGTTANGTAVDLGGTLTANVIIGGVAGTYNVDIGRGDPVNNFRVDAANIIELNGAPVQMNEYGAGAATFDASGNISSVSDERLKYIQGNYGVGLKQLLKVNPIVYKWKPISKMETAHSYIGFSAQNIRDVLGDNAIGVNREGYLSIQDRAIMAAMVNSIKELKDLNDKQQKEINDLKKALQNK